MTEKLQYVYIIRPKLDEERGRQLGRRLSRRCEPRAAGLRHPA